MVTHKPQLVASSTRAAAQKTAGRMSASTLRTSFKTLRGQFILLALSSFLICLILALTFNQAFQRASRDLDTIGNGSIPSIDAAQSLAQYLEDIDARAADYLATAALSTSEPCSVVGYRYSVGALRVHDCDDHNITSEITLANQQLYLAAHNVTYPGERTAIERIMAGFEEYIGDIAIMRSEYGQATNVTNPQDPHMLKARQAYQQANVVLSEHISQLPLSDANGMPRFSEAGIPACTVNKQLVNAQSWALSSLHTNLDCLSGINKMQLQNAYDQVSSELGGNLLLAVMGGIVLWLLLSFSMLRMILITHRLVNLGLLVALLGSLILGIGVISHFAQLSGQHGDFGQMVNDDYKSVYAAALLKRYGTAANADESRWLIALEYGDKAEAERWQKDWQDNIGQVRMSMDQALRNQTWTEEITPLADMQASWLKYTDIDTKIRLLATNMNDPERILNAETESTGASNTAFGNFSDAVDALSHANRLHYDQTFQDASGYLSFFTLACIIVFPLLGLSAVWGIYQRLKDF